MQLHPSCFKLLLIPLVTGASVCLLGPELDDHYGPFQPKPFYNSLGLISNAGLREAGAGQDTMECQDVGIFDGTSTWSL